MNSMNLDKKVEQVKTIPFSLPEAVSLKKTFLPDGVWGYVFQHTQLGELGRLLILPHPSGESQFVCEVSGDVNDPITQQRQTILAPITQELMAKLAVVFGKGKSR
jgi:hypothetical protein